MEDYNNAILNEICEKCGQNPLDTSQNKNLKLCKQCIEESFKYPFPKWIYIFAVTLICLSIFAALRFNKVFPDYINFKKAEKALDNLQFHTAYNGYKSFLEKRGENSEKAGQNLFICSMSLGDYETAGDMFDRFYAEKEVSDSEYETINDLYNKLESYYTDVETFSELELYENTEPKKIIRKIKGITNYKESAFFQYMLAGLYITENDFEQALKCLIILEQIDPDYPSLYSGFASVYRHLNDFKKANDYLDKALQKNKEDTEAYRQFCVLNMLKGDYKSAVKNAAFAYDIDPQSDYLAETLAIAYYLNGDSELCEEVVAFAKENEFDMSDYEDLTKSHKTLEDIYIK